MASVAKSSSLYLPEPATVVKAVEMTGTEKYFKLEFANGRSLGHQPGQFVEVSVMGIGEAPISVSSAPSSNGSFELVVRKTGRVTGALHSMEEGAQIGVRGPYGTNFPTEDAKGKDLLFVGGGIGLVPLRSFINYVLDNRGDYGRVMIFFGAKTPSERLFTDELAAWESRDDVEFLESVDRGDDSWTGNVGVITTLFPKIDFDSDKTACTVVGPPIMYKFVLMELIERNVAHDNIYLSLERRMKCGIGKCGHCQINGLYACQDGPVFKYSDIAKVQEAI